MFEQKSYLKPQEIILPASSTERLESVIEICHDELPLAVEHRLITEIVKESNCLIQKEDVISKPDIQIGSFVLSSYFNCTDTARVQLSLCNSINLEALALFSGGHASVVVPSKIDKGYWHLGGDITPTIKSSERLDSTSNEDKIKKIKEALNEVDENTGAYVYRDWESKQWSINTIPNNDIRGSSPIVKKRAGNVPYMFSAAVIVRPPLAHSMLHAIDVLDELRKGSRNEIINEEYNYAKSLLKHLVPRL